ncbi:MAG TPA: selenocysteine-specific translation elongation factor [Pyrinomonadaceae bacterium]|nr:selenocysteine-specific translation elongation factor [Pyrinomonadaceae bacterium]
MQSIIVGTAGHIDHGKSALVRALTGKDPDRLPEEKRRGITIDLGFADLDLDGVRLGFVDVPGHERFVKNMLAGAHGIDIVALVIAADEGVMPQTREHFDICRLLGVQTGLIVITKIDLVEEELIPLVRDEAEELVVDSFLEGAPMLAVSAKTGVGLTELKNTLRALAVQVPARSTDSVTRLPVDRAFSMKGFGAVVTGTLVSGELAEGDEFQLLPALTRVRARGVQVHGKPVRHASAGQRTAVNLVGIDTLQIERGMMLAPVGRLRPTQILDVHLSGLRTAPRALRSRARIRLHIHGAEVLARLQVLEDRGEITPGEEGFAQLRLDTPVVAVAGERFVIRSFSPVQTTAGGVVLDPLAVKHRRRDLDQVRHRLQSLFAGDRPTQLSIFIESAGVQGLRLEDLAARTGWNDKALAEALEHAIKVHPLMDCEGVWVSGLVFKSLKQVAIDEVKAHHKKDPLARGIARETLRERHFAHAPPEVFRQVVRELEREGSLVSEKEIVRAASHSVELSTGDAALRDRLAQTYERAGLEPRSLDEAMKIALVSDAQKHHGRKILQLLIDGGILVRVQGDLFFHRKALDMLIGKLRKFADQNQSNRTIDVAEFKDLAGVSRKYAIPLLEFFDRERITRREGDRRVILGVRTGESAQTMGKGLP